MLLMQTTWISVRNSGTNLHMTSYYQQRTLRYKVPDNHLLKISDLIHPSSMKKNNNIIVSIRRIPSGRRPSKQWIYQWRTSDFLSIFTSCIQPLHKDTRRLQLNRVEMNVEFVLAPQHETSYDAEITTKRRLRLLEKNKWSK